jgi:AcrR family transcriptional regulator
MPRTPLTKEAVLRAAVELADKVGVDSLTMRKLAEKLGVEAMSLYHHVANKEAILDGMIDLVFSEIELPSLRANWKSAMRRRAISAREVLTRHTWAIGLLESRSNPGLATLRHHDAVIGCLRKGGFSIAMAAHAFSALDSYIYGFVMQEVKLPFQTSEELEAMGRRMMAELPLADFPWFTEMMVEHAMKPGYAYAKEFTFGLDLILDGLERAL